MMILAKVILLAVETPLSLVDARGIEEMFVECFYLIPSAWTNVLLVR